MTEKELYNLKGIMNEAICTMRRAEVLVVSAWHTAKQEREQHNRAAREVNDLRQRNRELEAQVSELAWQCRNGGAERIVSRQQGEREGKVLASTELPPAAYHRQKVLDLRSPGGWAMLDGRERERWEERHWQDALRRADEEAS